MILTQGFKVKFMESKALEETFEMLQLWKGRSLLKNTYQYFLLTRGATLHS